MKIGVERRPAEEIGEFGGDGKFLFPARKSAGRGVKSDEKQID